MKNTKVFLLNSFILTLTTLFLRIISMSFNIYVSNKVGTEAIGVFSLIMSIYMFAITIAVSGIGMASTYIVSEQFAKKNYVAGINATKTCILFAILFSSISSAIIFVIAPFASKIWLKNSVSALPISLIGLGLPLISISAVINGYFTAIGKSYKNAIAQVSEIIGKVIVTFILLQLNSMRSIENVCVALILGDVISEIFSFTLNVIFYNTNIKQFSGKRSSSFEMKKKILKFSFPIAITSYIRSGLSSFKQFLIPFKLEMSGLSYSIAISKYGLINGMVFPVLIFCNVFFASFSSLLVPEFSRLLACEQFERMKDVCNKIMKTASLFCICVSGIFFFFSNELSLSIYQNLESAPMIKLFSPLVFFMYVDNIIDNILKGINKQTSVMICNIVDLIVTIGIIYFVVPVLGINGYILSIFVSELLNFTVSIFQLKKNIKYYINPFKFIVYPIFACIFSNLIVSYFHFDNFSILPGTVCKISAFVLVYTLLIQIKINVFRYFKHIKMPVKF